MYVYDVVAEILNTCWDGGSSPATPVCRARLGRVPRDADSHRWRRLPVPVAGAEAVFTGHRLERCFRDLHTGSQHIDFSAIREQEYPRILLGVDSSTD